MSARGVFITGTDTGCGKTRVSVGLLNALRAQGLQAVGMKPVASGSERVNGQLRNEDALALQAASCGDWPYETINPYAFAPPIAPHVAAEQAGVTIERTLLAAAYAKLAASGGPVVVEGVGGWRVPLGRALQTADLVRTLNLPVVLVVGLQLGCINHAWLTMEAIRADGLRLAGWVANAVDPDYAAAQATIDTLTEAMAASPLVCIAHAAPDDVGGWRALTSVLTEIWNTP